MFDKVLDTLPYQQIFHRKFTHSYIWDKVFKSGPSKNCGRQPSKNLNGYGLLRKTVSIQIFKGCLPQILLGPILNTLSHIKLKLSLTDLQVSLGSTQILLS